jgi:hypothetical protein
MSLHPWGMEHCKIFGELPFVGRRNLRRGMGCDGLWLFFPYISYGEYGVLEMMQSSWTNYDLPSPQSIDSNIHYYLWIHKNQKHLCAWSLLWRWNQQSLTILMMVPLVETLAKVGQVVPSSIGTGRLLSRWGLVSNLVTKLKFKV